MKSSLLAAAAGLSMIAGFANAAPGARYIEGYDHATPVNPQHMTPNQDRISANLLSSGTVVPDQRVPTKTPPFNPFLNSGLNGGGG